MKIETLSIVVGTEACNAACPFCVSKMTARGGLGENQPDEIARPGRLSKALQFAERMGVTTVILTGKGEPTLFPQLLLAYISHVGARFPFVELQTNGIVLAEDGGMLKMMAGRGLTTVAISVVGVDAKLNASVYYAHRPHKKYLDLPALIGKVHDAGLSVRLTGMMMKDGIDCPDRLAELIDFAREHKVEQVTVRPITRADNPEDATIAKWTEEHTVPEEDLRFIRAMLHAQGTLLLTLRHGAEVFDVFGQNVCLSNCLTPPEGEDIRQIIYFPDGHLRYDWQKPGAILM